MQAVPRKGFTELYDGTFRVEDFRFSLKYRKKKPKEATGFLWLIREITDTTLTLEGQPTGPFERMK